MKVVSHVRLNTPRGEFDIRAHRDYYIRRAVERKEAFLKLVELISKKPESVLFPSEILSGKSVPVKRAQGIDLAKNIIENIKKVIENYDRKICQGYCNLRLRDKLRIARAFIESNVIYPICEMVRTRAVDFISNKYQINLLFLLFLLDKYYSKDYICVVEPVLSPSYKYLETDEEKQNFRVVDMLLITKHEGVEFIEIKSFSAGTPAGIEVLAHIVSFLEKVVDYHIKFYEILKYKFNGVVYRLFLVYSKSILSDVNRLRGFTGHIHRLTSILSQILGARVQAHLISVEYIAEKALNVMRTVFNTLEDLFIDKCLTI